MNIRIFYLVKNAHTKNNNHNTQDGLITIIKVFQENTGSLKVILTFSQFPGKRRGIVYLFHPQFIINLCADFITAAIEELPPHLLLRHGGWCWPVAQITLIENLQCVQQIVIHIDFMRFYRLEDTKCSQRKCNSEVGYANLECNCQFAAADYGVNAVFVGV